jgi:hypothetical protein
MDNDTNNWHLGFPVSTPVTNTTHAAFSSTGAAAEPFGGVHGL